MSADTKQAVELLREYIKGGEQVMQMFDRLASERDAANDQLREARRVIMLYRRWEHAEEAECRTGDEADTSDMLTDASFAAQDFVDKWKATSTSADGADTERDKLTAELTAAKAKLQVTQRSVDDLFRAILIACSGIVCTTEKGYRVDGGVDCAIADLKAARRKRDEEIAASQAKCERLGAELRQRKCQKCKGTGSVYRSSQGDYIDCHSCDGKGS